MRIILVKAGQRLAEMLRMFLARERFVVDHLDGLAAAGDACAMVD